MTPPTRPGDRQGAGDEAGDFARAGGFGWRRQPGDRQASSPGGDDQEPGDFASPDRQPSSPAGWRFRQLGSPAQDRQPPGDHQAGAELATTHQINLRTPAEEPKDDYEPPRIDGVEAAFLRRLGRLRFMREEFQNLEEKLEFAMKAALTERRPSLRRAIEILFTRTIGRFGTIMCRWIEWAFFTGSVVRFVLAVLGHGVALALLDTIPPVHDALVALVQALWWLVTRGEPVVD